MEVKEQFGDDITIIGVPGLADPGTFEGFIQDTGTDVIPHILDDGAIWNRFGIRSQSTYVYVDDDGSSRSTGFGNLPGDVAELIAN